MRVVAGSARGRRLQAPPGDATRPTLDRVREALFNALVSLDAVDGARVLDLFAGSGALGIEALSRGASHCTFVERARPAHAALEANLVATGLAERAEVLALDAVAWLDRQPGGGFDLVLLDPPYATDDAQWAALLAGVATVAPDGVVVIESGRPVPVPAGWDVRREKRYGDTLLVIACPSSPPPEPS
jgi:16S rRNA (guanine966-N2)-methyltransferase